MKEGTATGHVLHLTKCNLRCFSAMEIHEKQRKGPPTVHQKQENGKKSTASPLRHYPSLTLEWINGVAHYFCSSFEDSNSACPSRLMRSYRPWIATPISRQHLGASRVSLTWGPGYPALGQPKGVTPSASKRVYSCSIPNHGTYSFT